ncbi:MAG: GAF domain-containing protein [Proteobacteria bacterium]|uniref:GAF domain-containing protein n=1 Tax=Aquabacterium sp. TaxID=1872578 RepID=UPI0035C728D4|nr:GAF domain-containing protein [Pseudomonadota bacterium]
MSRGHAPEAVTLSSIRRMCEGVIPATMCTVSDEGMPHLCYLSQVEYIDEAHVALSFQFFNRSRENILATRRCAVTVDDPYTAAGVRLQLLYLRTESSGPLFERMKAKLAGIATHSGMDKVYHLQGADIYEVQSVETIPGRRTLQAPQPRCDIRAGTRAVIERISASQDMATLLDETLLGLRDALRIDHAIILLLDADRQCLYTIASLGYERSGVGAEIPLGQGLAGLAAREGTPLRIGHMTMWQTYARAIRQRSEDLGLDGALCHDIPLPGLAEPRSQLAVPLRLLGRVVGVLLVESTQDQHFSHDDEDALVSVAAPLALSLSLLQPHETASAAAERPPEAASDTRAAPAPSEHTAPADHTRLVTVHHHPHTDSIFLDQDYLIKGVAGAILWRLVNEWAQQGRQDFSNRELRMDPGLRLPDVTDNLEARLILLQRRLAERAAPLQIVKTGRGRFRLEVAATLALVQHLSEAPPA